MCGIFGVVSLQHGQQLNAQILREMSAILHHRGPDDEGYYCDGRAGLGIRRLSIIDLDGGHQPITNESQTLYLVFNGEIYNYRELRQKLLKAGHTFTTQSDSEVIVHAYEEWGHDCVTYFNGMFAFAIWDTTTRLLFLGRDRLGIKPLYYWTNSKYFVFGSELSAVRKHPSVPNDIDLIALDHFLTLEYIPGPRTILRDVCKVPPGHHLTVTPEEVKLAQYWTIPYHPLELDEQSAAAELATLIDDAVRMRLVSDVPSGVFLSGGLDSSSVLAAMACAIDRSVQSFSIGFDDTSYNELPDARAAAALWAADHVEAILTPNINDLVTQLVGHLDEPLADFSIFPTYLVSHLARNSVKVALCGDGGDELFGGYDTYVAQQADRWYRYVPGTLRRSVLPTLLDQIPPQSTKKGLLNKTKRFVEGGALPAQLQHTRWMIFLREQDKVALYQPALRTAINGNGAVAMLEEQFAQVQEWPPLAQQQHVDIRTYLADNILTKVDRMSMAASLEARVPLLDHRIVEFALNLPPSMKVYRGQTKRILRQAMQDRVLRAPCRRLSRVSAYQ